MFTMSCTLSHAKTDHALSICTVLITKLYKPTVHYISQLPSKNSFMQWVCGWFFVCCPSSLLGIGLKNTAFAHWTLLIWLYPMLYSVTKNNGIYVYRWLTVPTHLSYNPYHVLSHLITQKRKTSTCL